VLRMIQGPLKLDAALAVATGAKLTVTQLTTDVTEWNTYFAPEDDIHGALITELTAALAQYPADQIELHSSQYGFTDADVAGLFAQFVNPNSRFLFDKTQAGGTHEAPLLADFKTKVPAAQVAVGTSSVAHQILHTKAVVLLFPDGGGWTFTGSFNLSASAEEQFNIVDVVRSRSRAALFAAQIDAMFTWVSTHEAQT
jgi:hypothetical protein